MMDTRYRFSEDAIRKHLTRVLSYSYTHKVMIFTKFKEEYEKHLTTTQKEFDLKFYNIISKFKSPQKPFLARFFSERTPPLEIKYNASESDQPMLKTLQGKHLISLKEASLIKLTNPLYPLFLFSLHNPELFQKVLYVESHTIGNINLSTETYNQTLIPELILNAFKEYT